MEMLVSGINSITQSVFAVFEYKPVVAETFYKIAFVKSAIMKPDEIKKVIGQQYGRGDIQLIANFIQPLLKIIFIKRHVGGVNHIPFYFIFFRYFSPYPHSTNYIA